MNFDKAEKLYIILQNYKKSIPKEIASERSLKFNSEHGWIWTYERVLRDNFLSKQYIAISGKHSIPQGTSQSVPRGVPRDVLKGIPRDVPRGVPWGIPRGTYWGIPRGIF